LPWRSFQLGETYVVDNVLPWNKKKCKRQRESNIRTLLIIGQ
jgi:hypothetical protein